MNLIKLDSPPAHRFTLIPHWFIDHQLSDANGDFVKVYLVLQRLLSSNCTEFSASQIADILHLTESDVIRALKFWATKNVLTLEMNKNSISSLSFREWPGEVAITQQEVAPAMEDESEELTSKEVHVNLSPKPQYNMEELSKFMSESSYKDLIYVTGRYLGKNLTQFELATLISFHDWLGLSLDVIEWLVEYCASNEHRNMRYIEKVAIEWADRGINSIEKAKNYTETFNKKYFVIKKSLGFSNRTPVPYEIKLMDKWIEEFQLNIEIILEACNRTMKLAPNGSFNYADKILSDWHLNGVKTMADVAKLDEKHNAKTAPSKATSGSKPKNKFNNFEQNNYDFDNLEKIFFERLLKEGTEGDQQS